VVKNSSPRVTAPGSAGVVTPRLQLGKNCATQVSTPTATTKRRIGSITRVQVRALAAVWDEGVKSGESVSPVTGGGPLRIEAGSPGGIGADGCDVIVVLPEQTVGQMGKKVV
jgi:hypothetical protein